MIPNLRRTHLLVNLTDDFNGKDLTEFRQVAKKCQPIIGQCIFPEDNRFIHIMTNVLDDGKDIPDLAVNYTVIPAETGTMSMFTYISKLAKRIAQMNDKDFILNKDFKMGPDGDRFLIPALNITTLAKNEQEYLDILDEAYSPVSNRNAAKRIFFDIQKKMFDYFNVK